MVDTVTSQTLYDTTKRSSFLFTNKSDGTGESVIKIDASELTGNTSPADCRFDISAVQWNISTGANESVDLNWAATANTTALVLSGSGKMEVQQGTFTPIRNSSLGLSGCTGDLNFSTSNFTANSTYTILININKILGYVGSPSSV